MSGIAHLLFPIHKRPKRGKKVWRSFSKKTRERFSWEAKPLDHLGGLSPEDHMPRVANRNDLDYAPEEGASIESIDVLISL